jgi:hypothetical protein
MAEDCCKRTQSSIDVVVLLGAENHVLAFCSSPLTTTTVFPVNSRDHIQSTRVRHMILSTFSRSLVSGPEYLTQAVGQDVEWQDAAFQCQQRNGQFLIPHDIPTSRICGAGIPHSYASHSVNNFIAYCSNESGSSIVNAIYHISYKMFWFAIDIRDSSQSASDRLEHVAVVRI